MFFFLAVQSKGVDDEQFEEFYAEEERNELHAGAVANRGELTCFDLFFHSFGNV